MAEKYSLLKDKFLELEGIVTRWKHDIEYVHGLKSSSSIYGENDRTMTLIDKKLADEKENHNQLHQLQLKLLESEGISLSDHYSFLKPFDTEELIEIKGRYEVSSQRADELQKLVDELLREEVRN